MQVMRLTAMTWVSWETYPIISSCSSGVRTEIFLQPRILPRPLHHSMPASVFFSVGAMIKFAP